MAEFARLASVEKAAGFKVEVVRPGEAKGQRARKGKGTDALQL